MASSQSEQSKTKSSPIIEPTNGADTVPDITLPTSLTTTAAATLLPIQPPPDARKSASSKKKSNFAGLKRKIEAMKPSRQASNKQKTPVSAASEAFDGAQTENATTKSEHELAENEPSPASSTSSLNRAAAAERISEESSARYAQRFAASNLNAKASEIDKVARDTRGYALLISSSSEIAMINGIAEELEDGARKLRDVAASLFAAFPLD